MSRQGQEEKIALVDLSTLTKGASVNLVGGLFGKTLLFFLTLFIARLLGAEGCGIYFLGISLITFLIYVSLIGLEIGVLRFVSIFNGKNDLAGIKGTICSSLIIVFCSSLVISIFLYLASDLVAGIFKKPELGPVLAILAFAIPSDCLCKVFLASTRGLKHMQYTAYVETSGIIALRLIFAISFVLWLRMGVKGMAVAYVLASMGGMLAALYFALKVTPLSRKDVKSSIKIKELLSFSLPMVLASILFNASRQVDILMLGWLGSANFVGIYAVAARLVNMFRFIYEAFSRIMDPFVSDLHAKREFFSLSKLFKLIARWNMTLSLPVALFLVLFPSFFMNLFGPAYITGTKCLIILTIANLLSSMSSIASSMISMTGRSDITFKNNILMLAINFALNYILIPPYGILGAAFAVSITAIILMAWRIYFVYSLIGIHPFQLSLWKPIIAGLISACTVFLTMEINTGTNLWHIGLVFTLFLLLYGGTILVLRLDDEDIFVTNLIRSRLLRLLSP